MARTDSNWEVGPDGSYLQTTNVLGYNILINGEDKYLNFNSISGFDGYGFRDNGGVMEYKDADGTWTAFSGGGGGSTWIPEGVTTITVGGLPAGTDLGTSPIPVQDTLRQFLYPYRPPSTTISSSPSAGLYEIGNTQSSIDLTADTTKNTNPITTFVFKKNGTTIFTDPTPNPTGGTETYTDSTGVSTTTTYEAVVGDGTGTGTASETFNFVPVYYYGVSAPGLDISSDGGGLTKLLIVDTPSVTESFTTSANVQYFCYPDSYPALTSIKDPSGFQTIGLWNLSTVTVTNSYGQSTVYKKYEYTILNTNTSFNFTFAQ